MRRNTRFMKQSVLTRAARTVAGTVLLISGTAASGMLPSQQTVDGAAVASLALERNVSITASDHTVIATAGQALLTCSTGLQDDQDEGTECIVTVKVQASKPGEEGIVLDLNGQSLTAPTWLEAEVIANKVFKRQTVQFVGPGNQLLHVMPRVMIGVYMEPIQDALASHLRIEDPDVVMLTKVMPGLPADRAGLHRWDVIKQCNGVEPVTLDGFTRILSVAEPNDLLHLVVVRQGREMEYDVELDPYEPGMRMTSMDNTFNFNTQPLNTHIPLSATDPNRDADVWGLRLPGGGTQPGGGKLLIQPEGGTQIQEFFVPGMSFSTFSDDIMTRVEFQELKKNLTVVSERLSRLEAAVTALLEIQMETLNSGKQPLKRE